MDPLLERTPDLPVWPAVAPEAQAPHFLDLDPDQDIPLTPSLQTYICSRARGEVSHFLPNFSLKKTLGQLDLGICMLNQPKNI